MTQLKLRFYRPTDQAMLMEWIQSNPQNGFDADVLNYPTTRILCAYREDGNPVAFIPIQYAIVLESTALRNSITLAESSQALRDFTKAAELLGSNDGIREIYFVTKDEELSKMAQGHDYQDLSAEGWKTLRMKLA